ncbi:MAG: hypothetical protein R3B84_01865 [Zavarzinella sp.]
MFKTLLPGTLFILLPTFLFAQPPKKDPADEKAAWMFVKNAFDKIELSRGTIVETPHLVVGAELIESKNKLFAAKLERHYLATQKLLRMPDSELPKKFIMVAIASKDPFDNYIRLVVRRRPERDETYVVESKSDLPSIVFYNRDENRPETEAQKLLALSLLQRKSGNAVFPSWMKEGFAKAVEWRSGSPTMAKDRAAIAKIIGRYPTIVPKGVNIPTYADWAWQADKEGNDLIAASIMDYFTTGPGMEKFPQVMAGLVPGEGNDNPSFERAMMSLEWSIADLDKDWRTWLARGARPHTPAPKKK